MSKEYVEHNHAWLLPTSGGPGTRSPAASHGGTSKPAAKPNTPTITYVDVVVVGAGVSGLRAASECTSVFNLQTGAQRNDIPDLPRMMLMPGPCASAQRPPAL